MRAGWTAIGVLGLAAAADAEPAGPRIPAPVPDCAGGGAGITVCARRAVPEDRYRLPPVRDDGFDPLGSTDSVLRGRRRLLDADGAGADLTRGSCSATGASGATGCMIKSWREADQQRGR